MKTPDQDAIKDVQERLRAQGLCGELFMDAQDKEVICALSTPCKRHSFTGRPKVVGYISEAFVALDQYPKAGTIHGHQSTHYRHPVILQSEHEKVVRSLNDSLNEVDELAEKRRLEIILLKAENEQLRDDAQRVVDRLRAERDAYADPENWEVSYRGVVSSNLQGYAARYVGPTLSDNTERIKADAAMDAAERTVRAIDSTEPESVEGRVTTSWSTGNRVSIDAFGASWPEGTPVKITRIPGGDDGE